MSTIKNLIVEYVDSIVQEKNKNDYPQVDAYSFEQMKKYPQ